VPGNQNSVLLLPAFDEFIISYKDRSSCIPKKNSSAIISTNGIFRPIIVLNGQVVGLWKRSLIKNKIVIEPKLFSQRIMKGNKVLDGLLEQASERVRDFWSEK
jgi:hypothetical protein